MAAPTRDRSVQERIAELAFVLFSPSGIRKGSLGFDGLAPAARDWWLERAAAIAREIVAPLVGAIDKISREYGIGSTVGIHPLQRVVDRVVELQEENTRLVARVGKLEESLDIVSQIGCGVIEERDALRARLAAIRATGGA